MNSLRGWMCSAALFACLCAATTARAQTQPATPPAADTTKAQPTSPPAVADTAKAHPATTPSAPATAPAPAPKGLASLYDKLQLSASGAWVILSTDIRIDASNGDFGTTINVENDLGLASTILQPRFDARWRPGKHHEIEAGFQLAQRSGEKQLNRDVNFADTTFHLGASVDSKLTTNLLFLNYRYAIFTKERTQAGIGIGLGALFFGTTIDGLASANNSTVTYSASKNVTAPVGSLGLYGRFLFGSRWWTEADARVVKVNIDRLHAKYLEGNVGGRYFLSRKFGLELGGGVDAVTVDIDPKATVGDQNYGPSSRVKFSLSNIRVGIVYVP